MVIGDADIGFQLDIVAGQHTPDQFVVLAFLRNDAGVGLMLINGRQRRFQHPCPQAPQSFSLAQCLVMIA